ncbi:MAG: sulfide/dihydroorotate dehydrogenase-like FAD/NAD-binding protein [Planctomycetaceae bacterium]|jgi:ferredoxin--NADP+ reductase|nr:sulfide/dihydroorotate dehydrogenase-like FAD/NAD-binding protein [Planctomycetaceae bacterium]
MFTILSKYEICPNNWELVIHSPRIAKKACPGHFVIVMTDAEGERIPLTIADFDADAGTITMVVMAVGTSTKKLAAKNVGDSLFALIGPLGHPSELEQFGTVILTAGGVGAAPVFPIARALKEIGNRVIVIHGARNRSLLFWQDKLKSVSDEYILTTDDGSEGRKGLVTEPLRELLEENRIGKNTMSDSIGCIYAIGPAVMMKFVAETVRPFGVKTIASLNTVMIDGTGMCGGCRVRVGDETKFTCVDGPEFDALAVDWDTVLARQKIYCEEEKCSLTRYTENGYPGR